MRASPLTRKLEALQANERTKDAPRGAEISDTLSAPTSSPIILRAFQEFGGDHRERLTMRDLASSALRNKKELDGQRSLSAALRGSLASCQKGMASLIAVLGGSKTTLADLPKVQREDIFEGYVRTLVCPSLVEYTVDAMRGKGWTTMSHPVLMRRRIEKVMDVVEDSFRSQNSSNDPHIVLTFDETYGAYFYCNKLEMEPTAETRICVASEVHRTMLLHLTADLPGFRGVSVGKTEKSGVRAGFVLFAESDDAKAAERRLATLQEELENVSISKFLIRGDVATLVETISNLLDMHSSRRNELEEATRMCSALVIEISIEILIRSRNAEMWSFCEMNGWDTPDAAFWGTLERRRLAPYDTTGRKSRHERSAARSGRTTQQKSRVVDAIGEHKRRLGKARRGVGRSPASFQSGLRDISPSARVQRREAVPPWN